MDIMEARFEIRCMSCLMIDDCDYMHVMSHDGYGYTIGSVGI